MIRLMWAMAALLLPAGGAMAAPGDDKPAVVKDFEAGEAADAAPAKAEAAAKKKKPRKKTVKLSFTTSPRVKARVYFGRKLLGTTPFSVDWPRDSGPVDVVVRAYGYLPVNTRAYTFRDDDVSVRLTRPDDASRLLGYKAPVEPPPEEGADEEGGEGEGDEGASPGGAAPTPTPAAPTPATP